MSLSRSPGPHAEEASALSQVAQHGWPPTKAAHVRDIGVRTTRECSQANAARSRARPAIRTQSPTALGPPRRIRGSPPFRTGLMRCRRPRAERG
jgi:hypothetical protein